MASVVGDYLEESISRGIVHPGVVVWTPDTSLQVDGLSGNLFGGQLAGVGHPAGRLTLDGATLLPRLEVLQLADGARVLDPLDHLGHGHEVHVVVVGQDLVHPVQEGVEELGVVLQPRRVEVQAEGSAVLLVVAVEVVVQEVVELVAGQDIGARVHHGASR